MKKKAIFSILILILGLLEVTVLDSFKLLGAKPNLLLASVVIAGLIFDLKWAVFFSVFAGILKDSFSTGSFGINTLLFSLWGFLIIKLSRKIPLDSRSIRVILAFIIVILHNLVKKFVFFIFARPSASIGMFLYFTFLESLYTAAILPLLFKIIESTIYPPAIE